MTTQSSSPSAPVLVGSRFFQTGRGSTALRHFRSLRRIGTRTLICDAYSRWQNVNSDPAVEAELRGSLVSKPGDSVNIYHLNGDEIEVALSNLQHTLPDDAYNIVYPFWELSKYPASWADKLKVFDEVWAPSVFIQDSLKQEIGKPIQHMPLPVEISLSSFLGRDFFGLASGEPVFLFFFDFLSYIDRKNPEALLRVFEKVIRSRPYTRFTIVIKVHNTLATTKSAQDYQDFLNRVYDSAISNSVVTIDKVFSENEMSNLVRCCDCFVSLHRSEGFGLGMAEAMFLGKPVVATGYSGNLDFMNEENSCLVDFELIPVIEEQYPFAAGQVWAEPDLDQASWYIQKLLDEPEFGRQLGRLASRHIRTNFSYLAMGLRYKQRLDELQKALSE